MVTPEPAGRAGTIPTHRHPTGARAAVGTIASMRVPDDLLVHLRRARDLIDRDYAEPLDLDQLAAAAGVSKYHFLRCFSATYGTTPAAALTERRIERAQDLLRATNLTVTEVCMLVGYSSLGSFSSTFRRLVGITPSAYQAEFAATGVPPIPGCFVFMHGLSDRRVDRVDRAGPEPAAAADRADATPGRTDRGRSAGSTAGVVDPATSEKPAARASS